jgi:murein DD-endopeptidase MepM/ murein hydrolase activator NlpD
MRERYWMAGLVLAGGVLAMTVVLTSAFMRNSGPPSFAEAEPWSPMPLVQPQVGARRFVHAAAQPAPVPRPFPPALPLLVFAGSTLPAIEPPLTAWSREIASGETLDALLAEAGLSATVRAEVALALGAEYDLRRLRPGHSVDVFSTPEGLPRLITLYVDGGVRIEATFGEQLETRVTTPDPQVVTLAGEVRIESSLFAALADSGMPARFAVDLAQMLGGTVDFRRELQGGETLRLLWREAYVERDRVGQPELNFASLDLGDALYEVVWPVDGTGRATIFLDGEVQRVFAQPVDGARLSSVFGRRVHPVFGNVRMHTGVDFAAAQGTPVRATAPGRIAFIGRRGGYGRVVEIAHGTETMTRYAHLSAVPDGLIEGQRVTAGDVIGEVGETGTATGPNLHYEVLVDGRPTDPLSDERLAEAAEREPQDGSALERLTEARVLLEDALARDIASNMTERL